MLVLLAFAFVSGIVTILSPCILPVLPIVLSGGVGGGKARPLGIIAAFVISFTVFTLALSAIVQALGIPPDALRIVAVVLLIIFGLVMLVPALRDRFELLASRLANRRSGGTPQPAAAAGKPSRWAGFWSGIPVGFSLGLVWTPCVGPIMASVISLALTQKVDSGSVFITLAYAIGTSIPMLAIMLGGRTLLRKIPGLQRNMANIQKVFGVLMIVVGVAVAVGWDRRVQTALLNAFPNYGSGLTAVEQNSAVKKALSGRGGGSVSPGTTTGEMISGSNSANMVFTGATGPEPKNGNLSDYGLAPKLVTKGTWFNTEGSAPLTMADLRGKVVVVDFWTYSCVNCVRTIPYLKAWYKAYHDKGLVIIGVHTPEFEFEKRPSNVQMAMKDLGVTWPVVLDNDYREWNAYGNQFWPAHYFIDANGHVRYFHFGEGDYATSEKVIQKLLRERGTQVSGIVSRPDLVNTAQTPETYLGYSRGKGFATAVPPVPDKPTDYKPAKTPDNGQWNLKGTWTITAHYIVPDDSGVLQLGFNATNVYLVIAPEEDRSGTITVTVDGKTPADTPDVRNGILKPDTDRLYQLVGLDSAGRHNLTLQVKGKLRLYAFTFG